MHKLDKYIGHIYDTLGTKFYCNICNNFCPSRLEFLHIKGWGRAQKIKGLIRKHIIESHSEVLNAK